MKLGIVLRALASLLFMFTALAWAQEKSDDASVKRKGTIKGKVISDDGQPLAGANVNVSAANATGMGGWRQAQTDEEGNFSLEGLPPALYSLTASSAAFVEADRPLEQKYYRLGDFVNVALVKGGVISGRVTNVLGEPMIAAPLRIERVSDLEGRKTQFEWIVRTRKTDDRGMYRVYGLPPGKYLIAAIDNVPRRSTTSNAYEFNVMTFYPSATREGATEVTVNPGEEVRSIDIRHRGERGHSISGKVTGAPADNSLMTGGIDVDLRRYPGNGLENSRYIQATDLTRSFEMFTVADGEYELEANVYGGENKSSYKSTRRRVTVKGSNVTGIVLHLVALSSLEAKVEWEATPEKERKGECQSLRPPLPEETMLWLVQDDPKRDVLASMSFRERTAIPSEKQELKFGNLEAGNYRFIPRLLDEAWYIKAIAAKPVSASQISNLKSPMAKPADLAKQGIALKPGEKRKDIILTLATGAASISGRVVSDKDQSLPSRLRVYAVPAEPEAAEDLLRYAEQKTKDGAFTFKNLAPGKYWLLARKVADDEPDAKRINPLAWDITTRKTLRAEAEAANVAITVTPCQKLNDATLKFTLRK